MTCVQIDTLAHDDSLVASNVDYVVNPERDRSSTDETASVLQIPATADMKCVESPTAGGAALSITKVADRSERNRTVEG